MLLARSACAGVCCALPSSSSCVRKLAIHTASAMMTKAATASAAAVSLQRARALSTSLAARIGSTGA